MDNNNLNQYDNRNGHNSGNNQNGRGPGGNGGPGGPNGQGKKQQFRHQREQQNCDAVIPYEHLAKLQNIAERQTDVIHYLIHSLLPSFVLTFYKP